MKIKGQAEKEYRQNDNAGDESADKPTTPIIVEKTHDLIVNQVHLISTVLCLPVFI